MYAVEDTDVSRKENFFTEVNIFAKSRGLGKVPKLAL